eukprot:m.151223 g.151223  ORF g.151223 m.151223 type:complete len:407 (+) comp38580_c0_seq2:25-1245(+)
MDRVGGKLCPEEFFARFLLRNKPCVIGSEITETWKARKRWVKDGKPNLQYLIDNFGESTAPVADCSKEEFGSHPKTTMHLKDYLSNWKESSAKHLYLKDWHFVKEYPGYKAYETPPHFSIDWINEFWENHHSHTNDDYRFVYMGPKGSWTPFHADVYRSYSWSANVCGIKRWILYPPGEEEHLRDCLGNLPFDVTSDELCDVKRYPNAHKALKQINVIQNSGEVIFIPSGWFHQVENLEDTISINHNWGNSCNVEIMYAKLRADLQKVEEAISDCKDMEDWTGQCQKILLADSGLDYHLFLQYILFISRRIFRELDENRLRHQQFIPCSSDLQRALKMTQFGPIRNVPASDVATAKENSFVLYKQFECKRLQIVLQDLLTSEQIFTHNELQEATEIDKKFSKYFAM